jgi:uncharacterized membrane protein YkvA (DUF1232 family)
MKKFLIKNWRIVLAIVYVLLPLDFIPDVIPFLGVSDDILVLLGALIYQFVQYRRENPEAFTRENFLAGIFSDKKKKSKTVPFTKPYKGDIKDGEIL